MITLIDAFGKRNRSLLRAFIVQKWGYAKVSTTKGLNLTADAVLEALKSREKAKKQTLKAIEEKGETSKD